MACVACIYSFVSLDFVSCLNSVNLCCFTFLPVREGGAGAQHWYWKWRVGVYRGVGWEFFSFSQRSGLWGILANQINFHHLLIDNLKLAITPYCFQCQNFLSLSQVLLVTSSFMSPTESRNGTNTSRVRFFGPNQLQKSTAQEKWDRVKIVCSQPYSKVRAAESLKKSEECKIIELCSRVNRIQKGNICILEYFSQPYNPVTHFYWSCTCRCWRFV